MCSMFYKLHKICINTRDRLANCTIFGHTRSYNLSSGQCLRRRVFFTSDLTIETIGDDLFQILEQETCRKMVNTIVQLMQCKNKK